MVAFDETFSGIEEYSPIHFTEPSKMFKDTNPDVVSIAVWDGLHAPSVELAATHGVRAILCEKPMSDSIRSAAEMIHNCREKGVKLAIGHQRRFLPSYNLARDMILDGEIGEVRLLTAFARDGLPNYSSHISDTFRYLLSDPECEWVMGNVERKTDQWARAIPIEDRAIAMFGFTNGVQASILSGLTDYDGFWGRVYGSDGMIEFTVTDVKIMNIKKCGWTLHKPNGIYAKHGTDDVAFEMLEGSVAQATEFARWVEGEIKNYRNDAINGYKALEMVHAVYESARTYSRVTIPMENTENPLRLMIESGQLPVVSEGKYDIRQV
jgi:predicted dehydrogenase